MVSNEGLEPRFSEVRGPKLAGRIGAVSKRFQMVGFRGPSQEKSTSEIFRFGYGKAANDKKVPDPVGSGCKGIVSAIGRTRRGELLLKILLVLPVFSLIRLQGFVIRNVKLSHNSCLGCSYRHEKRRPRA